MVEVEDILEPCPFCGNDFEWLKAEDCAIPHVYNRKGATIICTYCQLHGPVKDNLARAIDAWNDLPRRNDDAVADTEEGREQE